MALFEVPKRAGRSVDSKVAKKSKTNVQVAATVKGGGTLIDRINTITALVEQKLGKYRDRYELVTEESQLVEFIDVCIKNNHVAIDTETDGLDPLLNHIAGPCLFTPGRKGIYVPINHISYITQLPLKNQLPVEVVAREMQRLIDAHVFIDMFNAKFDIRVCRHTLALKDIYCDWDSYLGARLLNENEPSNKLKPLHNKYCLDGKGDAWTFDDLFKGIPFTLIPPKVGYLYAARDPEITYELGEFQRQYLNPDSDREDMRRIYWVMKNIEMPLVDVVADMEDTGVLLDLDYSADLSEKYNKLLAEAEHKCYSTIDKYAAKIEEYKSKHADHGLDNPINIASPKQLAVLFYDILKEPVVDKKHPRSTDKNALPKMKNDVAKSIVDYRKLGKLVDTYIDKLPNCINPNDGRIHCEFKQYEAVTGRMACVSEGTKISSPSGDKNVEDVQPGDWVYCYTDQNELTLSKVKNRWMTGIRQCVKLDWISKYNHCLTGSLICTPDHFIKTERGWVMAKDLKTTDSILYVHRRVSDDGAALYAWRGQGHEEEHVWIKQNYFKCPPELHLHHVDGCHSNNNPDNLTVTTCKAHNQCHRSTDKVYGDKLFGNKLWSEESLIQVCESVDWELTKIKHDYATIIKYLRMYKINYILKYTESYSSRQYVIRPNDKATKSLHLPLNKSNLQYALELANGNIALAAGYFGVSVGQFKERCDKYELLSNHNIVAITYLEEPLPVYDLEVEEHHNFIANELCVHNCCDPNLQNIPSHNKDIRKMFKATDGYLLMSSDFSQQEPKCLAALCRQQGDPQMYDTFMAGKDLYSEIASKAFNKPYEDCLEFYLDENGNKTEETYPEGKERRTQAKSILLGVLYGRGENSIAEQLNCSVNKAKSIKQSVFKGFPAIKQFEQDSLEMASDLGYVTTVCGRKRRLPDLQLPEYEFKWIDGAPPDDDLLDFNGMNEPEYNTQEIPDRVIDYYWNKLDRVNWRDKPTVIEEAKKEGICIVDNGGKIADATRQTVNSRIQGSAADLTKLAMIELNNNPRLKELGFRLLIPVHDEVIAECPEENIKECKELLASTMSHAAEQILEMPIRCDVVVTKCWYGKEISV